MSKSNKECQEMSDSRAGFAEIRDIAQGAVFIIASGKSAKDFPISQFADVPMITMNGAISMFSGTDIEPFFYVCTDKDFPLQQPSLFAEGLRRSQRVALWSDQLETLPAFALAKTVPLRKARAPSLINSIFKCEKGLVRGRFWGGKRERSLGFSKDLSQGFFDARTVAYLALQIAHHVGFSKVFLVGVDLDQSAGRFYEDGSVSLSPCGLDQHFESRILPSLQIMAEKVVEDSFSVYNLSPVSRIPESMIPRVTLEDVEILIRVTN